MVCMAVRAGSPMEGAVEFLLRTLPPALLISELNHTVRPSYWAPWISMRCGLPCLASCAASEIISPHVFGGFGTRSDRYQSSSVLELNGTATSLPFHSEVDSGPGRVSARTWSATAPVH